LHAYRLGGDKPLVIKLAFTPIEQPVRYSFFYIKVGGESNRERQRQTCSLGYTKYDYPGIGTTSVDFIVRTEPSAIGSR
jgi:hypothetical protein